jgi:hypothetical protein
MPVLYLQDDTFMPRRWSIPVFEWMKIVRVVKRPVIGTDSLQICGNCMSQRFDVGSGVTSVGIGTGWMAGVRFPAGARDFSILHSVHTGSGAHPASYPMGDLSLGVKRPGRETNHSYLPDAEVKNGGDIRQFPHMSSWLSA